MQKKYSLECCVDSAESALAAVSGGADRLELCSNLIIGGTTPSISLFKEIRKHTHIPIHILIRPRFGDFLYSEHEVNIMCDEISAFKELGAEGIVIGSLQPNGALHMAHMERFVKKASSMSVTLHRAFDMCADPISTLEQAKQLGIDTILTSGQAARCVDGIPLLNQLSALAGNDIMLLAGAGINAAAVETLLKQTSLTWFHMSGKKVIESAMAYRNPSVSMGLPDMSEYEIWRTDADEIRKVRAILDRA